MEILMKFNFHWAFEAHISREINFGFACNNQRRKNKLKVNPNLFNPIFQNVDGRKFSCFIIIMKTNTQKKNNKEQWRDTKKSLSLFFFFCITMFFSGRKKEICGSGDCCLNFFVKQFHEQELDDNEWITPLHPLHKWTNEGWILFFSFCLWLFLSLLFIVSVNCWLLLLYFMFLMLLSNVNELILIIVISNLFCFNFIFFHFSFSF